MKFLVLFVCLLQITSSIRVSDDFDQNDFQLCEEFEYKNRSINGYHVEKSFFEINFTEFEKTPGLANESYYMDFKSHLRNFTKLDTVEKTRIKIQILHAVRRSNLVI